jgi:teichuronic acid biosynthesis glycosyltransferase TuaC
VRETEAGGISLKILVITKRQYMNKDLLSDRFGRFREIPLALAQKGHEVVGLCLSYQAKKERRIQDGSVHWKSINATKLKFPGLLWFFLEASLIARKSDVIWACSDSFYGVIGCVLGKIYRVPVVFDIYDNFGNFAVARWPLAKQLYHWALKTSDAITCLSKPFAEFLDKRHGRRKHVYPLEFAVRHDLFRPLDKDTCRRSLGLPLHAVIIGTAGLLDRNRDVHLLFQAFELLKDKHPSLHVAVAGPRDGRMIIPKGSKIHDLGILPFDKVPFLLNALDVAVVCYSNDDFGMYCFPQKTREFMACNIPLIAAGVGSLKELLGNHPEWLYEPGNARSLAVTLEKRLSDPRTDYKDPPSWYDLATQLEEILARVCRNRS